MKKDLMKKILASAAALFMAACSSESNGFSAGDVCPESGTNAYGMPNRGIFTDDRDGQVYKYTTIGDQVWMAQNLNYASENSVCYNNDPANCEIYGRLYLLLSREKGKENGRINYNLADSVCPSGWHVPSNQEWLKMVNTVGDLNDKATATRLKATNLWNEDQKNGTDECGFSAIPGGYTNTREIDGKEMDQLGIYAKFLSLTLTRLNGLYVIVIGSIVQNHEDMDIVASIRCVKD